MHNLDINLGQVPRAAAVAAVATAACLRNHHHDVIEHTERLALGKESVESDDDVEVVVPKVTKTFRALPPYSELSEAIDRLEVLAEA